MKFWCRTCELYVVAPRHRARMSGGGTVQCPTQAAPCDDDGVPMGGIPHATSREAHDLILSHHLASSPPDGAPVTSAWRERVQFHFLHCTHEHCSVVRVESEYGAWDLEVCVRCGQQVTRQCPHLKNEWRLDGKVLVCLNCGVDGT